MTNDEGMTKSECQSRPRVSPARFGFCASDFLRHANFGIRHFLAALSLLISIGRAAPNDYFKIALVDQQTGRGVPLVELRTVNNISLWTDSNGIIAFDELGLMDQEVYFHVRSHGSEYSKDGFGNRGVKLKPSKGGSTTIKIKRLNIAERLYRM